MGNASQALAPGRSGRAAEDRESRSAALSPSPAGYEAKSLDPQLRTYLAVCEKSVRIAESLAKKAGEAVEALNAQPLVGGAMTLQEADDLTRLHERLTKANLNLVKSVDELSRLRSFLAGGPDSRPELGMKSEIELRALVIAMAPKLGFRLSPVIDAEVVE